MDERVSKLKSPEDCEKFARNAADRSHHDLALEARRRAIELRAEQHGAVSVVEKEALSAVYAYEEVLRKKNGRRTPASRTWQMIDRHGIIAAVERAVNRDSESVGYTVLVEMGMEDFAFEAVILRHPECFSGEAVQRARERLDDLKKR